jgi:DNA-binding NtrC family response regulator
MANPVLCSPVPPRAVLIIDDEVDEGERLSRLVARCGFTPLLLCDAESALTVLRGPQAARFDAVILDMVMPDLDGLGLLRALRDEPCLPPIIVHSTAGGLDTVPSAIRAGAIDFFIRPVGAERVAVALANAGRIRALERTLRDTTMESSSRIEAITGQGEAMARVREQASRAARLPMPLLVQGPDGAGKRHLLRAVHAESDRADKSPLMIDGRVTSPRGVMHALVSAHARHGALIVAHIDRLCCEGQRVLAQGFEDGLIAFGTVLSQARKQVRLYATATEDLSRLVHGGVFLADLQMRLAVQQIALPALNERSEDIPALAFECLIRSSAETGALVRDFSAEALATLVAHSWPGQIRELNNLVHRATLLANDCVLGLEDFPALLGRPAMRAAAAAVQPSIDHPSVVANPAPNMLPADAILLKDGEGLLGMADIERITISHALAHCGGHVGRAATALGIGRSTLYRKAHDLGLLDPATLLPPDMRAVAQTHAVVSTLADRPSAKPRLSSRVPLGVVA